MVSSTMALITSQLLVFWQMISSLTPALKAVQQLYRGKLVTGSLPCLEMSRVFWVVRQPSWYMDMSSLASEMKDVKADCLQNSNTSWNILIENHCLRSYSSRMGLATKSLAHCSHYVSSRDRLRGHSYVSIPLRISWKVRMKFMSAS